MTIEDELRTSLRRHADATPAYDDPLGVVDRRVAATRRRRLAVAGAATAAVVVVGGVGVATRTPDVVAPPDRAAGPSATASVSLSPSPSPSPSVAEGIVSWPTRGNRASDPAFARRLVVPWLAPGGRVLLAHHVSGLDVAVLHSEPEELVVVTHDGNAMRGTPVDIPRDLHRYTSVVFDHEANGRVRRFLVIVTDGTITSARYATTGDPAHVDARLADGFTLLELGADADWRDTGVRVYSGDEVVDSGRPRNISAGVVEEGPGPGPVPEPLREHSPDMVGDPSFAFCARVLWEDVPRLVLGTTEPEHIGLREWPRLRRIVLGYAAWTRTSSRSMTTTGEVRAFLADFQGGWVQLADTCTNYARLDPP